MIAVQMLAMPVLAAGVVNGLGHSIGYRNYEVENASTNIVPWGLIVGGEELHNNHHAFPSSAKFSIRPWEFDAGWLCVVLLESLGLAKVKRVALPPRVIGIGQQADPDAATQSSITACTCSGPTRCRWSRRSSIRNFVENHGDKEPAHLASSLYVLPCCWIRSVSADCGHSSRPIRRSRLSTNARSSCGNCGKPSTRPRTTWSKCSEAGVCELKQVGSRRWKTFRARCAVFRLLPRSNRTGSVCGSVQP